MKTKEVKNTPNGEVIILNDRRTAAHKLSTLDKYLDMARLFVQAFPVNGAPFISDDFDTWAFGHKFLERPQALGKDSAAWVKHVRERHKLKEKINMGGRHPAFGPDQFQIVKLPGQKRSKGRGHIQDIGVKATYRVEGLVVNIKYLIPNQRMRTESYFTSSRIDTEKAINSVPFHGLSLVDQRDLEDALIQMKNDQEVYSLRAKHNQEKVERVLSRNGQPKIAPPEELNEPICRPRRRGPKT